MPSLQLLQRRFVHIHEEKLNFLIFLEETGYGKK